MNYLVLIFRPASMMQAIGMQLLTGLQQDDFSWSPLEDSIRTALGVLAVLSGIGIVLLAGGMCLRKTRFFRHMALFTVQDTNQGYTARTYPDSLIGLQGTAQTPLRPAGKAVICGVCYDVKTLGIYVAPGETVVVIDTAGTSLTVQAIPPGIAAS
jgi:membrane-bound serine protease (ClpP class)